MKGRRKRPFSKSTNQAIIDQTDSFFTGLLIAMLLATSILKGKLWKCVKLKLTRSESHSLSSQPPASLAGRLLPQSSQSLGMWDSPTAGAAVTVCWMWSRELDLASSCLGSSMRPSHVSPVPAHRWISSNCSTC